MTQSVNNSCRFVKETNGAAIIEAAIIAPLLIILGFCATDMGIYFFQRHVVTTGIRDAARYMARYAKNDGIGTTQAQKIAVYGSPSASTSPRISNWSTADVVLSVSSVSASTLTYSPRFNDNCRDTNDIPLIWTASTSVQYVGLRIVATIFTLPPLTASHSERCIGQ